MKCPDCGAQEFYVKDPEDQYNITEFDLKKGVVNYTTDDETETYCDRCAWHDKFRVLKK